jgi:hypothetical protein
MRLSRRSVRKKGKGMIRENQKLTGTRIPLLQVGIVLGAMLFVIGSTLAAAGVKIVNPVHGNATIKGEEVSYYYNGARIVGDAETTLVFKQGKCSIADKKGKEYSQSWIHVAGGSAGLSFTKQAPISMKTLAVELEGGKPSDVVQWNTSMVDGPEGSLEFKIPKGGYVILNFLWEVPRGFSPSRVKIGDLIEVSLNK